CTSNTIALLKSFKNIPPKAFECAHDYLEVYYIQREFSQVLIKINHNTEALRKFFMVKGYVEKQKKVFSHGDFFKRNIFDGVLVDWDQFGFYPFGVDLARLIFYSS